MPTKLTKPIFLCGYTSSGKTTIGKELARQLDVPFYDTDELITSQTGQTPQQIFASQGNEAFRNIEHEITKQVSSYPPCVISTGGGLLTYSRNGDLLSKAGTIIYLNRPFENCYKILTGLLSKTTPKKNFLTDTTSGQSPMRLTQHLQ